MSTLKIFQVFLIVLGAIGVSLAFYWFHRRPSPIATSILFTASVLILILGHTLPFIWLVVWGSSGSARVVEVDCGRSQKHHIRYTFAVGSTFVEHLGSDGYGNPTCEAIKVGDMGLVTYLPSEPNVQVWGRAKDYVGERLLAMLIVLVCLPVFSYIGVKKRLKNSQ